MSWSQQVEVSGSLVSEVGTGGGQAWEGAGLRLPVAFCSCDPDEAGRGGYTFLVSFHTNLKIKR